MISRAKKYVAVLLVFVCVYMIFSPLTAYAAEDSSQHETVKVGFFAMDGYHMMDEEGNRSGYGYDFLRLMARYWDVDYEYVGYDQSCPVVAIVEKIAKENSVPVTLLCDTNHVLSSAYSEVVVVGAGADAVDYKLISICHKGDIVVSQDYGVAAMALGKGAYAIHQSGKWYTNDNIDQMLMERHLNKKARRSSRKCHIKGPKKRTEEDDERFAQSFEKMLLMVRVKEGR